MCFAFTMLHRRVMGEKMKRSRHGKILSFRQEGESGARVRQEEKSTQRRFRLGYQQRQRMRVSKVKFVRGQEENRREEGFQWQRSGLESVIE